ncbi:MAG TPA: hypothetical protein VNX68_16160 [Nitrosopumilaceae archaeon]|jgi:hypothetical protein|nr:hypothetical protein [Nitrosopumilaceae archaeon]
MISKYMLATKAYHLLGDISSDTLDLCTITSEDKDNYYGAWKFGYGFMNVRFPKDTTRDLTPEEKNKWNGELYEMSGLKGVITIDGATNNVQIPSTPFIVYTKNSKFEFESIEADGNRNCFRNGVSLNRRIKIFSLVLEKSMVLNGLYITSAVKSVDLKYNTIENDSCDENCTKYS